MFSNLFKSACELDHVELSILNSITGKILHLYGKKSESESSLAYLHADMKEEGNTISLKLRDSEHFRYSQQTCFYKTVTDYYLFKLLRIKLLRTKDRSITQLQVSSGESLYDENPYYSYKLAPLPQAPNQ